MYLLLPVFSPAFCLSCRYQRLIKLFLGNTTALQADFQSFLNEPVFFCLRFHILFMKSSFVIYSQVFMMILGG
jgi:hypothetical protein